MTTAKEILEKHGLLKTHWGERIMKAEKAGGFTTKDRNDAGNWTTCACGKQDKRIPKGEYGLCEPEDPELRALGLRFMGHVHEDEFVQSAGILVRIENRAAQVLAETVQEN